MKMKMNLARGVVIATTLSVASPIWAEGGAAKSTSQQSGSQQVEMPQQAETSQQQIDARNPASQKSTGQAGKAQTSHKQQNAKAQPTIVKDVETLLDSKQLYDNKKISVTGEVKRKIDSQSFVLEGGGILNDEIVVVTQNGKKLDSMKDVKEDAKVNVTGTLRVIPVVEYRREVSWDLDPQIEAELQDSTALLIVDEIARR